MADLKGNRNVTNQLLRAFQLLRRQIAKDTNVAELGMVSNVETDGTYECVIYAKDNTRINCFALEGLGLSKGNIVLILFLDYPYKTALRQARAGNTVTAAKEDNLLHQLSHGIIIGKL